MRALLGILARGWQALAGRGRAFHVLAIGDSHVRVFEHWYFGFALPQARLRVVYVPGATAIGIHNPRSVTGARRIFREALATSSPDLVVVHLGEVDTAYTIWKRAERMHRTPQQMLRTAVNRYWTFIEEMSLEHRVVVLSACLPTLADQAVAPDGAGGIRSGVQASQRQRTALTLKFNELVARRCDEHGIPFLDAATASLGEDGLVRPEWTNREQYDHHYARLPFARWLAARVKQLAARNGLLGRDSHELS